MDEYSEKYDQDSNWLDTVNKMSRVIELLQDENDQYLVSDMIRLCVQLLENQGMDRDTAWRFVNEEWYS